MTRLTVLTLILITWLHKVSPQSLSCYVGLGNRSARDKQPVIACPEDGRYVCVKMYGGGMGDQIKRYCEKLEREEYDEVVDNEARLEAEEIYTDLNCYPTQDRGREVSVCRCHTDKCNASPHLAPSTAIIISASVWWGLKYL